jgi:hypothetical protein
MHWENFVAFSRLVALLLVPLLPVAVPLLAGVPVLAAVPVPAGAFDPQPPIKATRPRTASGHSGLDHCHSNEGRRSCTPAVSCAGSL